MRKIQIDFINRTREINFGVEVEKKCFSKNITV